VIFFLRVVSFFAVCAIAFVAWAVFFRADPNLDKGLTDRYKVSKQADVLMLFYLFSAEELGELFKRLDYPFEYETIPRNVDYYVGRMTHGSTLCRVVTAWVLARSDRTRSTQFFMQALQSDVADIQQGTTAEGIHLGAMAGTVDLVQRVWTGIEVKDDVLRLHPELPRDVDRLDMRVRYRGHSLDLRLTRDELTVRGHDGAAAPISLCVDGKDHEFVGGTTRVFRLNANPGGMEGRAEQKPGDPVGGHAEGTGQ
jgi:trehalose/maltose hydrolase-like predicted phosphorylase